MNDAELLSLLRDDPEQGCEALLRQYTGLVLAICRRKLSGICTAEDMEELSADILFEFYQKRERISPEKGSIRALLSVAAERRCIDRTRTLTAKSRPKWQPLEEYEEYPDTGPSPDETAVTEERRQRLLGAVKALGEPDAEILIRKYYWGETAAQIAAQLSMKTGAVEMRLSRARKRLAEMLGGAEW